MKVALNAMRLSGQRLGVGRYIEYLLKQWNQMLGPTDEVAIYVRDPFSPDELGLLPNFHVRLLRPKLTGSVWENVVLPRYARQQDVLFGPSYTLPFFYGGKSVVAIHSVNEVQQGTHPLMDRLTYAQVYRRSAQRADAVIVPSRSTMSDIQQLYNIPAEKIEIIPQAADDSFRPTTDARAVEDTRRRYLGEDRPYIVFVGKLSQRRNIPLLLEAFGQLKQRYKIPHKLLLVGPNHLNLPLNDYLRQFGIMDSVIQTDGKFADHKELIAIYNAADLYVNASMYEGFSMTLVEALACGTPVVTVDRGALGEIAGDAALLIKEPALEPLSEAIYRVLNNPSLSRELRIKGVERARAFRWDDVARRTFEVLRRVAQA